MRINKFIAGRLGISRRKADALLTAGRITVDNELPSPGQDITDDNIVLIDGRALPVTKNLQYVLLHKPVGYVCSRDGQGSNSIYDLLPHSLDHLNPVGRLDKDSSGIMLLTNDGNLHQKLTHPSFEKLKVYQVTLLKPLTAEHKKSIEQGVMLSDGISKLRLKTWQHDGRGWLVNMHEGRNRQIRRTFEALGYRVTRLNRIQFGEYNIDKLHTGEYREIFDNKT